MVYQNKTTDKDKRTVLHSRCPLKVAIITVMGMVGGTVIIKMVQWHITTDNTLSDITTRGTAFDNFCNYLKPTTRNPCQCVHMSLSLVLFSFFT